MGKLCMELYLDNVRKRYKQACRKEKSRILEEFCEASGYHKKHAIRVLNSTKRHRRQGKEKRGRPKKYLLGDYQKPLKEIWLACDQLCGKNLKQALPLWLPHYADVYGKLEPSIYDGLLTMSASTIDRLLADTRIKTGKGRSGTKPGKLLKKHIPVKTDQWDEDRPGFLEADTVAHCGTSLAGNFVWSLTMTDICTTWTELRAVWNKGATGVVAQIKDIEQALPFDILGFDSDNGSEFLNWHLVRYFSDEAGEPRIQFTRSRPYHSDDNAHVEQKNWTHVRQLLGYERFSDPKLVDLMNELYKNELSLMNNYFIPGTKLIDKQRIDAKIIKKHDTPATPYQRLMESEHVSKKVKEALTKKYHTLNPFKLRAAIRKKVDMIFKVLYQKNDQKMCYK